MESLLKAFTFLPKAEIERLVEESKTNPGKREAQKTLAWEVTSFVHGEAATQAAIDASGALFGRGGNLEDIDEETLNPCSTVSRWSTRTASTSSPSPSPAIA